MNLFKKMNRSGYMLVEIIVASVIAVGIVWYLLDLVYKFKDVGEELNQSYIFEKDKNLLVKNIMNDIGEKDMYVYQFTTSTGSSGTNESIIKFGLGDSISNESECSSKECRKLYINMKNAGEEYIEYGKYTIENGIEKFIVDDVSYYKKIIDSSLVIGDMNVASDMDDNGNYTAVTIDIPLSSIYDDNDYSIKLAFNSKIVIEEELEVVDETAPKLEIIPYLDYISSDNNDKKIYIKAYDYESGLKKGSHTINYLFTTKKINSCDALRAETFSSKDFVVIEGNERSDSNKVEITVPNKQFTTTSELNLYVCSKNLVDNAGNTYNGIEHDELKIYDLEKITAPKSLFYLSSLLSCSGNSCSLGKGLDFIAGGVSLSAGTNFYYLWNQPMNLFDYLFFDDWPFVGAYVKLDDLKKVSGFIGGDSYEKAVNSAEIIFDDGTGTEYVFGYIPLKNGIGPLKQCLTTIPC